MSIQTAPQMQTGSDRFRGVISSANRLIETMGRSFFGLFPLFLLFLTLVFAQNSFAVNKLRVVTSEFPPYSYSAGVAAEGLAVDQVRLLLEDAGLDSRIEAYPWARAYEVALREPNVLIFLIARTPEREAEFHWIGSLIDFDVKLFRLKDRDDIQLTDLRQLADYKTGSLIRDVKGEYLHKQGVRTISYATEESGVHMLKRGYIDLMPAEINSFEYRVQRLGYSRDDFSVAWELEAISKPLYLALSKGSSPAVVEQVQRAFARMQETSKQQ